MSIMAVVWEPKIGTSAREATVTFSHSHFIRSLHNSPYNDCVGREPCGAPKCYDLTNYVLFSRTTGVFPRSEL